MKIIIEVSTTKEFFYVDLVEEKSVMTTIVYSFEELIKKLDGMIRASGGKFEIAAPTSQASIDPIKSQAERFLPQADPMLQPELKVERIA